jgi:mono/diheme cytochrome c family protein
MKKLSLFCLVTLAAACGGDRFTEPMTLGGETVSAERLNLGYEKYMLNCYACHGENGDGHGPASAYLRPQPRDFRTGVFKFAGVRNPGLPHTADMVDLVRRGLTGTAMLPWDVPESELAAVFDYIKTFSSARVPESAQAWSKEKNLGERIVAGADPWAGKKDEAVALGKQLFHVNAQCAKCHPAYVTQKELFDMTRGGNEWAYGELLYRPQLRASDAFTGMKILPIDFLYHSIKTVNPHDGEEQMRQRLYRVIGSGIQGAAMPTWKGALDANPVEDDKKLWALAYYVQSVAQMRGTPAGDQLRMALLSQPPFEAEGAATPTENGAMPARDTSVDTPPAAGGK